MQPIRPVGAAGEHGAHGRRIRTVRSQMLRTAVFAGRSVDGQIGGARGHGFEAADFFRLVNDVFGHPPVGRPFAAGNRDQAAGADRDRVVARERRRAAAASAAFHQRTQAGKDAEDVGFGGIGGEILAGMLQHKPAFLIERARFEAVDGPRSIGGADDDFAMPRYGKKHAAVGRLGNHQRRCAGQEPLGENQMNALADLDHRRRPGLVLAPQLVDEDSRGVNHRLGREVEDFAGFAVAGAHAADFRPLFDQRRAAAVVGHDGPRRRGGLRQIDGQTRIVELSVVIEDAASQGGGFEIGNMLDRLRPAEHPRRAQAQLAGQLIVELHPDPVERTFPPMITGNDKGKIVHQMRCVAGQPAALAQSFEDERNVALFKVANAAVHELGRAAGGALGEIRLFDQCDAETADGRVDRGPQPRGAAAHDDDIERLGRRTQGMEGRFALQR